MKKKTNPFKFDDWHDEVGTVESFDDYLMEYNKKSSQSKKEQATPQSELLTKAKQLLTKSKAMQATAVTDNVQAVVSSGNVVAKIVDGKWTSDSKAVADMLNADLKLRFIWGAIYTPNTYAEMAERAAKLLKGKVDYVIELPYEEGVIY